MRSMWLNGFQDSENEAQLNGFSKHVTGRARTGIPKTMLLTMRFAAPQHRKSRLTVLWDWKQFSSCCCRFPPGWLWPPESHGNMWVTWSHCLGEDGRKRVVPGKGKYKEHRPLGQLLLLEILCCLQNEEGKSHHVENSHRFIEARDRKLRWIATARTALRRPMGSLAWHPAAGVEG